MAATKKTAAKKTAAKKTAKRTSTSSSGGFTDDERSAMKQRAAELREEKARGKTADKAEQEEKEVLVKIAEMPKSDRDLAKRLHELIKENGPDLTSRTWYGMPAYAKDGKVLCFFQSGEKFKTRYAMLGFSDEANLDKGAMWPTSYALTELTAADEKKIATLIKRAVK